MIFRNLAIYLTILISIVAVTFGFGQQKVNTSHIQLTVPYFQKNEGNDSTLLLVKNGILKPISQSDAVLELRFYAEDVNMIRTIVIKCTKDSVHANRYVTIFYTRGHRPTNDTSHYKELAITNNKFAGMYKKQSLHLPDGISWQTFIRQIVVDNHIFELPDQSDLDNNKLLEFAKESNRFFRRTQYDLYVDGNYRSFEQRKALGYMNHQDVPAISYYKNIQALLNRLSTHQIKK